MTRATRQVLAVMVVATALCADHVVAAVPTSAVPVEAHDPMPAVVQMAGRLVSRLSESFRRVVPKSLPGQARQPGQAVAARVGRPVDSSQDVAPPSLSPFQFRLPPPLA